MFLQSYNIPPFPQYSAVDWGMSADMCDNGVEKSKQVISPTIIWRAKIALEIPMATRGEGGWMEVKDKDG